MPTYTVECKDHGRDMVVCSMRDYMEEGLFCPRCEKPARVVITATPRIGPSDDHPLTIKQIGRTFTSKSELDKYFKEHPERAIVAQNDSSFVAHRDKARERAEKKAKEAGFQDLNDRRSYKLKQKADKARIKNEGAKIQV